MTPNFKGLAAQDRQAQKMEAIGILAVGIAHDFNNLLTVIHGYTELIVEQIPPAYKDCHENLERVLTASSRGRGLVNQILSFIRRDAGDALQPVRLETILKETLGMVRASIVKEINIREIIACESAKIMADPTQMYQIMMNLCLNASQAMSPKGGVMEIRLDKVAIEDHGSSLGVDLPCGHYCRLIVQDTGEGMDHETMSRIFEPFFTTKSEGLGSGMGLFMVQRIVVGHKGAIRVTSEKGRGASFHVFLPALPPDPSECTTAMAVTRIDREKLDLAGTS